MTIQVEAFVVCEGLELSYSSNLLKAFQELFRRIDLHFAEHPQDREVEIAYSWTQQAVFPTHEVWRAQAGFVRQVD